MLSSNLNDLTKDTWLKINLMIQKNSLLTSLTDSLNKFYDAFKNHFLGKIFNDNSFEEAKYVLLFFNADMPNSEFTILSLKSLYAKPILK